MRFAAKSFLTMSLVVSGLWIFVALVTEQTNAIGVAIAGALLLWNVVALIPPSSD